MAKSIIMPRQGQSVESCIITKIYVDKGSKLNAGDLLFAYETDKASFEEEADEAGVLLKWMFAEGDEVPVLETVCYIGDKDEDIVILSEAKNPNKVEKVEKVDPSTGSGTDKTDEKVVGKLKISPRARKLADEKGIDLAVISGSGPGGRIIFRDIEDLSSNATVASTEGEYTVEPLSNIRKLISDSMYKSLRNSAQLTHHLGANASRMLKYRDEIKFSQGSPGFTNITINDMVCFALITALQEFPRINAHLIGDELRIIKSVNLGLAVDTERGLMVPSLRSANKLSIKEFSIAAANLAIKSRKGSVDPDILVPDSASFTISNLGSYGVEMFTPVINLPQVAILGVNTISLRPVYNGSGGVNILPYIGLSLTYDHRALDGGEASRFLKRVAENIENLELDL